MCQPRERNCPVNLDAAVDVTWSLMNHHRLGRHRHSVFTQVKMLFLSALAGTETRWRWLSLEERTQEPTQVLLTNTLIPIFSLMFYVTASPPPPPPQILCSGTLCPCVIIINYNVSRNLLNYQVDVLKFQLLNILDSKGSLKMTLVVDKIATDLP